MSWFSNPVFRIFHWGPLIALGIIFSVSICTVSCLGQWHNSREAFLDLAASLQGGYRRSDIITSSTSKNMMGALDAETNMAEASRNEGGSSAHTPTFWSRASPYFLISFLVLSGSTLYCYLNAMWGGPGTVPPGWQPPHPEEWACLQYCSTCSSYKPPRAHHCRQCGRCILKMDHHCPWINTCVGHANHTHFTLFLAFAVSGCSLASCVMGPSVYWALYRRWYLYYGTGDTPIIFLSLWGLVLHMFVLGLAIGVVVAVGLLLYFQVRSILRNRTAIEDWILEKANHRRAEAGQPAFLFPYDLGRWDNVRQMFASVWCRAKGDGITWTVRPGCTQYTLTVEQLEQKACKRARAVRCVIRRPYSGSWLPVTHGFGVCCHPPCTDEPRLTLQEGDVVMVTRWKTYWLYGDCIPRAQFQLEEEERQLRLRDQFSDADIIHTEEADSSSNTTNKLRVHQILEKYKTFRYRGWFPRHCAVPLLEDVYRQSVPEREPSVLPGRERSAVQRFEEENMRRLRSRDHGEVGGLSRRTKLGRYHGKVLEGETRFLDATPETPKQGLYSNRNAWNYSREHMEDAVDEGDTSTCPSSSSVAKNTKKMV